MCILGYQKRIDNVAAYQVRLRSHFEVSVLQRLQKIMDWIMQPIQLKKIDQIFKKHYHLWMQIYGKMLLIMK
jgi:hypothetical protein